MFELLTHEVFNIYKKYIKFLFSKGGEVTMYETSVIYRSRMLKSLRVRGYPGHRIEGQILIIDIRVNKTYTMVLKLSTKFREEIYEVIFILLFIISCYGLNNKQIL